MRSAEEIKAALRREFPRWSIIQSSPNGRWWATRGPDVGKLVQHGPSCFDADEPETLRAQLRKVAGA
ncbi:hypothetical protein J4573_42170 [Actinomadura barringtoniae]|uniref:Uncharacterized protein n=1 Tax=Actinomadura barringtoniae TaxID=1427535 RepID=A0A939T5H5_9ACTN|nr:hypothetical protein [Actinomadura barringtoniae]MBO2453756.1 hypothetical protein [Actinomadura barringtoniae]